jgi:hypothetical protein
MLSALRDVIAKFTARGFFAVRMPPDTTLAEDLADEDLVVSVVRVFETTGWVN